MTQWINDETFPSSIWNQHKNCLLLTKMQQPKNLISSQFFATGSTGMVVDYVTVCRKAEAKQQHFHLNTHSYSLFSHSPEKGRESDFIILLGPFKLEILYDSMAAATQSSSTLRIHWIAQEGLGTTLSDLCKVMHETIINMNAINKLMGNSNWVGA